MPPEDLPISFWCFMTKGEKIRLKLEGKTLFYFSSILPGKTELSSFTEPEYPLLFHSLFPLDLRTMCDV
jgi:hypothetical protein